MQSISRASFWGDGRDGASSGKRKEIIDKMQQRAERVEFTAPTPDEFAEVLTPEAVTFVASSPGKFGGRVEGILRKRAERQQRIDAGEIEEVLGSAAYYPGRAAFNPRWRRT